MNQMFEVLGDLMMLSCVAALGWGGCVIVGQMLSHLAK